MKKTLIVLAGITLALVLFGCELGTGEAPSTIPIREPYISVQPLSYAYVIGGEPEEAYTAPPTLEIDIYDWDPENGALSLQWYSFTDMADYWAGGGTILTGETEYSYTPDQITAEAGKRYYYYVRVTNSNDVTDRKVTSIISELAVISFRNVNDPVIPVITRQPAGGTYQFGKNVGALRVEAKAEGGILSYQWYSSSTFSADPDAAVEVEGAFHTTFIPDIDMLRAGKNYFFVVVTNTVTGRSATEVSLPATIEMVLGERAAAPRIDVQPKDQLAFPGIDLIEPLTVTAVSPDSGQISYQWYSNTRSATSGGTILTGATSSTYTPSLTSGQSLYYYARVTNTNNNVKLEKTAVVNTKVVKVSLRDYAGSVSANATINIPDPSVATNRYNYVRGYGGMDVLWANFPETFPEETELMYDPDQLGYNILRVMIPPTHTDMEVNMEDATTRLRTHYYENVQIVNKHNGYVLASPWSPPKEWKSNNSVNGGGVLIRAYYKLFANYLKSYAQHMYDKGAPVYAVSISNEPNYAAGYDGCEWEPEDMRDFFVEVGHFTDGVRGWGGGRETPVVLTVNGESANTPNINIAALVDPRSNAAIDLLARHVYGEQTVSLWNHPNRNGKEVWMTEHNINSANATGYTQDSTWDFVWKFMNDIDLVMRLNNENAFVWWASKRFYSMVGDGYYATTEGVPLVRGWGLSHYSKYTIDKTRIAWSFESGSTTGAGTNITHINRNNSIVNSTTFDLDNLTPRITAYVSEDGNEISFVMWTPTLTNGSGGTDMGTIKINLPDGFEIRGAAAARSTIPVVGGANTMMVDEEVLVSQDRRSAYVTLPRSHILSVKFTR